MAIKLYQYNASNYKAATDFNYPNKMQAGLFLHWWQEGYVSMDTDMAALLNPKTHLQSQTRTALPL